MRLKALAEIYTMHSFAPFWNRIPKNEENHGGERTVLLVLVESVWVKKYTKIKIEKILVLVDLKGQFFVENR